MNKKIAILQSNYIPWKGYFDIIGLVDEFILFDEMQYTRRDWRHRNKIKTNQGVQWITIPVIKDNYLQKIDQTKVASEKWTIKHFKALTINYSKTKYFKQYNELLHDIYLRAGEIEFLSQINYLFLTEICKILGITTKISWSTDYKLIDGRTERLVDLCKQAGATEYISGPAAMNYLEPELFKNAGIKLTWMDYSGYPEYNQLYPPFEHGVTILDLIFNEGSDTPTFMKFNK